jgi:hypothetical protein
MRLRAPHMKSSDWLFSISFAFLAVAILLVLRIPWSWIG